MDDGDEFRHAWMMFSDGVVSFAQSRQMVILCLQIGKDFAEGRGHMYPNVMAINRWVWFDTTSKSHTDIQLPPLVGTHLDL